MNILDVMTLIMCYSSTGTEVLTFFPWLHPVVIVENGTQVFMTSKTQFSTDGLRN